MRKLIVLSGMILLAASCAGTGDQTGQEDAATMEKIEKKRDKVREATKERDKAEHTLDLVTYLAGFADESPGHDTTPAFLHEAGDLSARILHDYKQATQYYDRVAEDYPDHSKAPLSLFTSAYMNESVLENKNRAEMLYKRFLDRYPEHAFAKDATFALETIDKDPEEILEGFRAQQEKE